MNDRPEGYDVEALKAANPLPEFLAKRGVILKRQGTVLKAKCPFHQEQNGEALTVWPDEGRWHCFGRCSEGGDVIKAVMRLDELNFKESCERLGGTPAVALEQRPHKPASSAADLAPLTPAQVAMQAAASRVLAQDAKTCAGIAKRRGWMRETVRNLALDGHLGWHEGKVAFVYPRGLKLRWQQDGERQIRWAFGGNGELWRQDRLDIAAVRRVFITEGETDAIALLDAGIEDGGEVAVVAIPGASCWQAGWNPFFKDRQVLVLTDADEAGEKAAARITAALAGIAATVARINPLALMPALFPPPNS